MSLLRDHRDTNGLLKYPANGGIASVMPIVGGYDPIDISPSNGKHLSGRRLPLFYDLPLVQVYDFADKPNLAPK